MAKKDDIDELLGETPAAPAKKTKAAAVEAPAEKPAKKTKAAAAEAPAKKVARVKAPISYAEGERESLAAAVVVHFKRSKKPIVSKDLAIKLETETRKLRLVLYALAKKELITLSSGKSNVAGMVVSPA